MSGTGQSDFRAPTSLTTVSGDQPVVNRDGTPTMQFYNFLQRLASLIGQPTGNKSSGSNDRRCQLSDLQAEAAARAVRPGLRHGKLAGHSAVEGRGRQSSR